MRLGIIGLPQSGKTTVFNALTRAERPIKSSGGGMDVYTAVVDVPDPRLDHLAMMFRPKKTTYAKVSYADIAGLGGSIAHGGIEGVLLNQLAQMDGLIHVVRCFENPSIAHPAGHVDPQQDIRVMDEELLLNDLVQVERKLERLGQELRKGGGRSRVQIDGEVQLFKTLHDSLTAETPLRDVQLSEEHVKSLVGYGFLTRKPLIVLLNLGDDQDVPMLEYAHQHSQVVPLRGKLEMELGQLTQEDAEMFMAEYSIQELGRQRVIRLSYELLGLQSFFTVGEDEVRAWTVRRAARAPEAAGVIHSDLEKGFIRVEVVSYDDLIEYGSTANARARGRYRLEGKDYPVQDGDILHILFSPQKTI